MLEDLFDEEKLREINDREKEEEILKRGIEQGREQGRADVVNRLLQASFSVE